MGARLFVSQYLMHYCVRKNMQEMIRTLIQFGGDNVNLRDATGWTPLLLAIRDSNAELVRYLIEQGAELNRDEYVMKELHIAITDSLTFEHFKQITHILLQHGLNIDNCNYWGETPLLHAIMLEKFQCAEFLIKEGANVNAGHSNRYPDSLMLARGTNNIHLLKILGNIFEMYFLLSFSLHFIIIYIVKAGLIINNPQHIPFLKAYPWHNVDNNLEDYLGMACRNPKTLQQLTRISIRQKIIFKMKERTSRALSFTQAQNHHDGSVLKYYITLLGLPKLLQAYLYDFTDIQSVYDHNSAII